MHNTTHIPTHTHTHTRAHAYTHTARRKGGDTNAHSDVGTNKPCNKTHHSDVGTNKVLIERFEVQLLDLLMPVHVGDVLCQCRVSFDVGLCIRREGEEDSGVCISDSI